MPSADHHRYRSCTVFHAPNRVGRSDHDHFETVNDFLGHAAGDAVLAANRRPAHRLGQNGAAVDRLGGDEFAVALPLPHALREARLAQLARILHTPVILNYGPAVDVAACATVPDVLGIREVSALQRTADAALYDGKHADRAVLATARHTSVPSLNGRRADRPGTHTTPWEDRMSAPANRDWIRGITIRQPWTTCIVHGTKRIENRPQHWSWRGWLLLHAGRTLDRPALRNPLVATTLRGRGLPTGAILGVARLADCHPTMPVVPAIRTCGIAPDLAG